jgi:hypothetical protein
MSRYLQGFWAVHQNFRSLSQSGDVELINTLLKHLAAHVYKTQAVQVEEKIDSSLFTPFPEFVHMFERRARVENKKGRSGKVKTSYTTIKATKPSTLSTVAPWEKESCQELYDGPWQELTELETEYISTQPLLRNYVQMSQRLTSIINAQWTSKQTLLRKTNHRLAVTDLPDSVPLWQRLNRVRQFLSEQKSIETCDRETLRRIIRVYDIIPSGQITLKDGFRASWETALKDGSLSNKYPATTRLILSYQANTQIAQSDEKSG